MIKIVKGKEIHFDEIDLPIFNSRRWNLSNCNYLIRVKLGYDYKSKSQFFEGLDIFHREIMKAKRGEEVDHIDGNRLNNCRSNLRICTRRQNSLNCCKAKKKKVTSRFKGVSIAHKPMPKPWRVMLRKPDGKNYSRFHEEEVEAAIDYNMQAIKYFGEYARLNNTCPDFT